MRLLYVNDIIFSLSSGELSHTVGILNNIHTDLLFITHKRNQTYLGNISNEHVRIKYINFGQWKILSRFFYNFFILFCSMRFSTVYVRETNYTLLSLLLFPVKKRVFLEVNGIAEYESENSGGRSSQFIKMWKGIAYRRMKNVIAVSRGIMQYLVDTYKLSNVAVVENGSPFPPIDKLSKKRTPDSAIRIIFVGNLSKWQDWDYLTDVLSYNREFLIEKNVSVNIYGNGKCFEEIQELIQRHELERVVFLKGTIKREHLCDVYPEFDAGLLIDKRIYRKEFLFSPLKFYEYSSFHLPTIFLTELEVNVDEGITVLRRDNFKDDFFNAISGKKVTLRAWSDTVSELEVLFNEKTNTIYR